MLARLLQRLSHATRTSARTIHHRLLAATRPAAAPLGVSTLADLVRGKPQLMAENALLQQQLVIL